MSNIPDIHKEKRYKPTISRIEKNINANRNRKKKTLCLLDKIKNIFLINVSIAVNYFL